MCDILMFDSYHFIYLITFYYFSATMLGVNTQHNSFPRVLGFDQCIERIVEIWCIGGLSIFLADSATFNVRCKPLATSCGRYYYVL